MANTTENPKEETIKCVVVGDNNVGKTRLICARAYSEKSPNSRCQALYTSHVPTVWAIDQYRMNEEVLQNARCVIDGTVVSLRLWDTFGDHHKNRKFAYGKADVVVICFSACDERSLRQVTRFWKPEVRKHCKNIPIILVGCKVDLRFADLTKLNKSKGYLTKAIQRSDIVYPDKCRSVATELDCPYYETSVVLRFGIGDVFENVCRAALIFRRSLSFWNSGLKKIIRPALQEPLKPPEPDPPVISQLEQTLPLPNLLELYQHELLTDVVFLCQGKKLAAHKSVLSASTNIFFSMFTKTEETLTESSEPFNINSFFSGPLCPTCYGKSQLSISPTNDEQYSLLSSSNDSESSFMEKFQSQRPENSYRDFKNRNCVDCLVRYVGQDNDKRSLYIVNLSFDVCKCLIDFCYCGKVCLAKCTDLSNQSDFLTDLVSAAQCFGLVDLEATGKALINNKLEITDTHTEEFLKRRSHNIKLLFIEQHHLSDVIFRVDNGLVYGHKALLAGGCDMMSAMFAGRFIESENKEVVLPQTYSETLQAVFKFIYLNEVCKSDDCVEMCELIVLANRLCLQTLVSQLELLVIDILLKKKEEYSKSGDDVLITALCKEVTGIIHDSQLYNAPDLNKWCLYFLSVNYNDACRKASKEMKSLPADIQRHLERNRWPPVWYIKQRDCYEKSLVDRNESYRKKIRKF